MQFSEKPIKVPDWDENKVKNCLLDCNGNQGSVSSFNNVHVSPVMINSGRTIVD